MVDVNVGVSRCPTHPIRWPFRPLFVDLRQAVRNVRQAMGCVWDVRD